MSDDVEVTFSCGNCGANPTRLVLPDDPTDDDIAKYETCGFEFGRYGDVKAKALDITKSHVEATFKDAFKGLKGWKVK